MLKFVLHNKLLWIGIHLIIGFLATFSGFPKTFGTLIICIGFLVIIFSKNKDEEALYMASYIAGIEVFLRMTKGLISYEMGKYGVMAFLVTGLLIGPSKHKNTVTYVIYILLLFLGIVFTQVPDGESIRKAIVFNLSGPLVIGISALYLYKRTISKDQLFDTLFFLVLPVFSMVSYMYVRTPDLSEIVFGGSSLGVTSGGFGPNQVATILGFGIFCVALFIFLKIKLTGYIFLDVVILAYFAYRGLLTFSRGGVITGGVAFIVASVLFIIYQKGSIKSILKYISLLGVFLFSIWIYTSDVTGGMLNNRYAGKNANGTRKVDATSGRGEVLAMQLESFKEAPVFGIGVGNGKYKRQLSDKTVTAASHNETSRLIEEHGLVGIIILVLLLAVPLARFYQSNYDQRAFIAAFLVFWFLTINHSAMRIAFPGFMYALSLIQISDNDSE